MEVSAQEAWDSSAPITRLFRGWRVGLPSDWLSVRLAAAAVGGDVTVLLSLCALLGCLPSTLGPVWLAISTAVLTLLWLSMALTLGAYRPETLIHPLHSPYIVAKATVIAGGVYHLLPLVGGSLESRLASMTTVLVMVAGLAVWRSILACFAPTVRTPTELIVVGAGWAGQTLAAALADDPTSGMRIAAFVDFDPTLIGTSQAGVPVHSLTQLGDLVHRRAGRVQVVLALADEAHAAVYERLTELAQDGVEVVSMAQVYEAATGRIPVLHLGNRWWAAIPRPSRDMVYLSAKRAVDVAGALVGLTLLGVVLPVLAPLLRRETGGSLFFVQTRVGKCGKAFRVIKLRTLPVGAADHANLWERKNRNRPARVGALLRATGIDELPQCLNVLRGEMSLIGPRPYIPDEVRELERHIPFFRSRALAKPGITGWAQVHWGYGLSLEDELEKLQYDLYYLGHQSFYLDLLIMLQTCGFVARRRRLTTTPRSHEASLPSLFPQAQPDLGLALAPQLT